MNGPIASTGREAPRPALVDHESVIEYQDDADSRGIPPPPVVHAPDLGRRREGDCDDSTIDNA